MRIDDLPAELRTVLQARVPAALLEKRAAAYNARQTAVNDPPGAPKSVPGGDGYTWEEARRLLDDDEDRQREFRRRLDHAVSMWLDDHPGVLMSAAVYTSLIENTRYWMKLQLDSWSTALDRPEA